MHNRYFMLMNYLQLNEGIEDLQKYFPKMDLENIKKVIALDPTYKGGNEIGKYGKWILRLVYNNIKNELSKQQYNNLLQQYPDGINPSNGKKFEAPTPLPSIKDEDLYKVTKALKQYDLYKNDLGKSIDSYKTLEELNTDLYSLKQSGIPRTEIALKRYNLFKKAIPKGLKIVFENENWIVGIPTTKKSSVMFGEDTEWCTTANGQTYYEYYTERGNLYINLNKDDGKLYQFHFETDSFMNEADDSISFKEIIDTDEQFKKFYLTTYKENKDVIFENENWIVSVDKKNERLTVYNNFNLAEGLTYKYYKEINELTVDDDIIDNEDFFKDDKELYQFYSDVVINLDEVLKDKSVIKFYSDIVNANADDKFIYGKLDIDEISYIYDDYHNSVSLEFIKQILDGDGYRIFDSYGEDLSISSIPYGKWDKFIEPLDIDWDTISNIIYQEGNYEDDDISESQSMQIYNYAMSDDFDSINYGNIFNVISLCYENGTINEAYNDIIYELKHNLPLDDNNPYSNGNLNIKLPIDEFKKVIMKKIGDGGKESSDDNFWLSWRQLYYNEDKFNISEPYNGWYGFDRQYWNEVVESFANKVKEIISSDKTSENDGEYDDEIDEVLKIAGIQLDETIEQTLYHGTTLDNALSILYDNVMYGDTQLNDNQTGVSTTRNLKFAENFAEMRSEEYDNQYVIFELDKDKLANNYKIVPYNDLLAYDTDYSYDLLEYEEVVIGNIFNILNYIKNVYVSQEAYEALNEMKSEYDNIPLLLLNAKIYNHNGIVKNKLKDLI